MSSGDETETFEDLFGSSDVPAPAHPAERFIEYPCPSGGAPLRVRTVGFHVLWANYLWNGARWMSDHIDTHPGEFAGKTVLELGAAAGLPSILAVRAGAEKVVVTDYPDEELVANMQKNIDSLLTPAQQDRITATGFLWGANVAPLLQANGGAPFDVIFMCDVIFNHSEHRRLLATLRDALTPDGLVWCTFSHYRPWIKDRDLALLTLAKEEFGFEVEHVETLCYPETTVPTDNRADSESLRTVYAYRFIRTRQA